MNKTAYVKAAALVTDDEWIELCKALGLSDVSKSAFMSNPEIVFCSVSKSTFMMALLTALAPLADMLHFIVVFLNEMGAYARTTGAALVLGGDYSLSRQQIEWALNWRPDDIRRIGKTWWNDLSGMLDTHVAPHLDALQSKARPSHEERPESIGRWMARSAARGYYTHRQSRDEVFYSEVALNAFEQAIEAFSESLPKELRDEIDFLDKAGSLVEVYKTSLLSFRSESDFATAEHEYDAVKLPNTPECEKFLIFLEQLRLLGSRTLADGFADLTELSLFRHRPQLYEVWVLCTILQAYKNMGAQVILDEWGSDAHERITWRLRYAKASQPVARIELIGKTFWLFYQLYNAGAGAMPDLSLHESSSPSSSAAVWIADPKYSEKGGYTLSHYRSTATNYSKCVSLNGLSCTLEYYDKYRTQAVSANTHLFFGIRPGSRSLAVFLSRLRNAHGLKQATIAVIDVSASFAGTLPAVIDHLKKIFKNTNLSESYIVFSDQAVIANDLSACLRLGSFPMLGSHGTAFQPALEKIKILTKEFGGAVNFLVFSDQDFPDCTVADAAKAGFAVELAKIM